MQMKLPHQWLIVLGFAVDDMKKESEEDLAVTQEDHWYLLSYLGDEQLMPSMNLAHS